MGVNLVGTPSYATTQAAGYIVGACTYTLLIENNNGASGNYAAADNLFLVNYNNGAQNSDTQYASIGLSTNGTDGQHHRGFIKAIRDTVNSGAATAGRLTLGSRDTGGAYAEVLHVTSTARVGIGTCAPTAKLHVEGTSQFGDTLGFGSNGRISWGGSPARFIATSCGGYNMVLATDNFTDRMTIQTGTGAVGVGTSSPCTFFHITNGCGGYTAPDNTAVPNIYVFNSNGSCTTAHSMMTLRTNNTGGGNPFISFDVNLVAGWTVGVDNADSQKFKIGSGWSSLTAATAVTIARTTLNFGIGTTSPSARLDVCGTDGRIQSRVDSSDGSTINVRPNAGKCGWVSFTEDAVADRWGVGIKNGDAKLYFASGNVGSAGGTTRMVLDGSGNLGVGTSAPCTQFMVKGGSGSTKADMLSISMPSGAGTQPVLRFDTVESNSNVLGRISTCDLSYFSSAMIFETAGCKVGGDNTTIERMRIVGCTGNVGVGTTSPTYKLEVNGTFYESFAPVAQHFFDV